MPGFGGDALGAVWSPDGQSVVFVATENDGIAARANVAVAPLAGGRGRRRAEAADARRLGLRRAGVPARRQGAVLHGERRQAGDLPAHAAGLLVLAGDVPAVVAIVTKGFDRAVGSWSFAARQPDHVLHRRGRRARAHLRGAGGGRRGEARRRRAAGRVHEPADSGARVVGRSRSPTGKARSGRRRSSASIRRPATARSSPSLTTQGGRVDRLAAAARVLVHRPRRPPHPQLHRAAAELRRVEEVSALRPDPRRSRQHVARRDHLPLELSPARRSRDSSC